MKEALSAWLPMINTFLALLQTAPSEYVNERRGAGERGRRGSPEVNTYLYLKVWDVRTKRTIYTLEKHDKPVHVVCLNDRYLFSGSGDKTIKVHQ